MFTITFRGVSDGKSKRLARFTDPTDSASAAVKLAGDVLGKQKPKAQSAVTRIDIERVVPGGSDVQFSIGD